MATCCPPGSLPYLAAEYAPKGTVVQLDGGFELYQAPVPSPSPAAAILICPDVWGWNGGRVRAIADSLAEQGYLVAVGKLLATPPLDGGTDGDALPPGGAFSMDWIKNFAWPSQQPKVAAMLAHLKAAGPQRIGVMGFCYGGHPCCWASQTDDAVACGVVCHPSTQLEGGAFGGSTEALLASVRCPFLLAPAGNDLPMWSEDGDFGKALKSSVRGGDCVFVEYPEMQHGWSCRGDLADAATARDVDLVMKEAIGFFAKHLQ